MSDNRDAYAPIDVWVTFYDPMPTVPADAAANKLATYLSLDDAGQSDANRLYNSLLVSLKARMLAAPVLMANPDQTVRKATSMYTFDLTFSDADGTIAEQLSYFLGEGVPIDVQFRYQERPDIVVSIKGMIASRSIRAAGATGMLLSVHAITRIVGDTLVKKRLRTSFEAGTTVEAIMTDVAGKFGWEPSKIVIQPGARVQRGVLYNMEGSVFRFMNEDVAHVLGGPIVDDTGEAYQFFVTNQGIIHFHQPAWQGNTDKTLASGAVEIVARQPDGGVLDWSVESNLFKVAQMGVAQAIETAWLTSKGTASNSPTDISSGGATVPEPSQADVYSHLGGPLLPIRATTEGERIAKTRYYYDHLRRQAIHLTLTLRGRADVSVFDLWRFRLPRNDGTDHYISGVYTAFEVEHIVDERGWTTRIAGYRLSFGAQDPALKAATGVLREARVKEDAAKRQQAAADQAFDAAQAARTEQLKQREQREIMPTTFTPGYF